jgi:hypothetical protein
MSKRLKCRVTLGLALLACGSVAWAAENSVTTVRETLSQWVQTRQLISRTLSEWDSDREMLGQTRALFDRELAAVAEQMGKLNTNSTVVEGERRRSEADLAQHAEALEKSKVIVADLEKEVRGILPLLPPPLTAAIQPWTNRLPADATKTKAGVVERWQTVVGLLNEVDKFNNAISVANDKQPNGKGDQVSVDVIYLGLGIAYFVDAAGEVAGMGSPGANGWQWQLRPELASKVRDAIAIYRSQKAAEFLGLPAVTQ